MILYTVNGQNVVHCSRESALCENRDTRAEDVTQSLEHLPTMCETLSFMSSTREKKEKRSNTSLKKLSYLRHNKLCD
jgi:hypothetical protein